LHLSQLTKLEKALRMHHK